MFYGTDDHLEEIFEISSQIENSLLHREMRKQFKKEGILHEFEHLSPYHFFQFSILNETQVTIQKYEK